LHEDLIPKFNSEFFSVLWPVTATGKVPGLAKLTKNKPLPEAWALDAAIAVKAKAASIDAPTARSNELLWCFI